MSNDGRTRCGWGDWTDPQYLVYHDEEWGLPSRDRRHLFEMLVLEGAQAGLSWTTILRKREGYRAAFAGFEPERVAAFGPDDVHRLMLDSGIVRNRAKIESAIDNARAVLALEAAGTPFVDYIWSFVGGRARQNGFVELGQLPAETTESRAMAKDLKRRGFRFMGPTTCYAFMQAVGLVNDHTVDCFRHAEVAALA
jgi:DNA-3-methyladenine glycosylase I